MKFLDVQEFGECVKINKFDPKNHINMVCEIIIRKVHEWLDGKCMHCGLHRPNEGAIVLNQTAA